MAQRRSRLEIFAEILHIAKRGAKKTRIVYGANLNFKTLKGYLEELEKAGLIEYSSDNGGLVKTTEKGKKYLQQFNVLRELGLEEVITRNA